MDAKQALECIIHHSTNFYVSNLAKYKSLEDLEEPLRKSLIEEYPWINKKVFLMATLPMDILVIVHEQMEIVTSDRLKCFFVDIITHSTYDELKKCSGYVESLEKEISRCIQNQ